jgi:hypothetical protein
MSKQLAMQYGEDMVKNLGPQLHSFYYLQTCIRTSVRFG